MKTLAHLCLTTALCALLTQCVADPQSTATSRPLPPTVHEPCADTTVHFAGKTFRRREMNMNDGTGDTHLRMTEL